MDLFDKIKRPKAEMRAINAFIAKLDSSLNNFKQKSYEKCIRELLDCKSQLIPIYDIYPKYKVSYFLMKAYYKDKQYQLCKEEIGSLSEIIEKINHSTVFYIKAKAKLFLYQTLSNIILNNCRESISNIINTIECFKDKELSAVSRAELFWHFIKGFLGEAGLNKTKQFEQFREYYDTMRDEAEEGAINKIIKDLYKGLMSTKTRKALFDVFNNAFFLQKYGLSSDNKIIAFLEKNLSAYVRGDNLAQLKIKVEGYLHLAKISFKDYFPHISIIELLTEQKFRLLSFDIVFGNLCGGFSAIFKEYFIETNEDKEAYEKMRQLMSTNIEGNETGNDNSNDIVFDLNYGEINKEALNEFMKTESGFNANDKKVEFKSALNVQLKGTPQYRLSRNEFPIKKSCTVFNPHYDFAKDVTIPPNPHIEDEPHKVTQKTTMNKTTTLSLAQKLSTKSNTARLPAIKTIQALQTSSIPLKPPKQSSQHREQSYSSLIDFENRDKKILLVQIQQQVSTQNSTITTKSNGSPFVLRNINNFLFSTLMNYFSTPPLLRKSDLSPIKIPNHVKSYFFATEKGTHPTIATENQDAAFMYEHFLLVKHFYLFGVCDGHGKNGKPIAEAASILFPSNLLYLVVDNNLMKRTENLNEIVISLFKMEEKPEVKEINILKYFFMKLDIDYDKISFVKRSFDSIQREIVEAVAKTSDDLKLRKKIDAESSGCTLCSVFIYGNVVYAVNVGDSRAVLGSHIYDENRWVTKHLTFDHKPDEVAEAKRIAVSGGRIAQMKNEQGIEAGPYRVWMKNLESTTPGLSLSRTIGDYQAKKIGVTHEPSIYQYKLNPIDKIIIIATDGLWENLSNEEAIAICSEFYENKKRAEDASNELIHKVKSAKIRRNKPYDDITCVVIFLDIKER